MFDNLRNILNFDEVLFEKRNKDYGAYQLRKRYNSVVFFSIIIASLIFSIAVILPFILRPAEKKVIAGRAGYIPVQMENFEPPEEIFIPPVSPPPPASHVQEIVKYIPPEIVDSIVPVNALLPTNDELAEMTDEDDSFSESGGSGNDVAGTPGEGGDEPFFFVETMPSFRGGDINKFRDWVQKRTNYPQEAIARKIQGKVFLTFIVETDGSVSNVMVVRGVDPLIDAEAVKAIESSPQWTPGLQRGQPVRVRYSIMLNFLF
ncbi:MAG TPA: energy transducer TonB [Bacteroidales bacterium]|nr:energy transducer TonB [Bacteroidales bacterium]